MSERRSNSSAGAFALDLTQIFFFLSDSLQIEDTDAAAQTPQAYLYGNLLRMSCREHCFVKDKTPFFGGGGDL